MSKNFYLLRLYLLFLLFSFIKISQNKGHSLVLPYKVYHPQLDEQSSEDEIMESLKRNYIYSIFELGNEAQKIPIFYTFNYSDFSFLSDLYFSSLLKNTYNLSKSNSLKNLGNNYVQEELYLNIENEIKAKNFTILNASQNDCNANYKSFIGLQNFYKKKLRKNEKNTNFLLQLKNLGLINYISFNINQTSEDEGFININLEPNEYSPELYSNEKKYTAPIRPLESNSINDLVGEFLWSIELGVVYYKFENKYISINVDHYELRDDIYSALLNPAYGFIRCPRSYISLIRRDFFKEFMEDNICGFFKRNLNFYVCNSDYIELLREKFPPLYFYYPLANYSIEYTFKLYFDDLFYEKGGKLYFLVVYDNAFLEVDKFASISEWVLGKPFLDKYQFSFDVENNEVSFYENKNGYKNKTIIIKNPNKKENLPHRNVKNNKNNKLLSSIAFAVLSISIILLSILCVLCQLRKKHKKFVDESENEIELKSNLTSQE